MKAVIIDDEEDSRNILASYLTKYCADVEICGFGESVATGKEAIRQHHPDLVFLDIEMPYGNGFDLLDSFDEITFETIFVTAFDHYAIQALNQSAAYYLLKPISIDELIKAVDKVREEQTQKSYPKHAHVLRENRRGLVNQKIMLPTMEGFEIVTISSIVYCEAVDNFTRFHLDGVHTPLLICKTLKYFEEILKEHRFLRIHRSHLINPDYVVRYTKGKGGYVTMKNNIELEVSAEKKQVLLGIFER